MMRAAAPASAGSSAKLKSQRTVRDGYSRYIVNWDLRESMTEADIEIVLQRAKELYPEARPRMISDNGPQFIAKDFI